MKKLTILGAALAVALASSASAQAAQGLDGAYYQLNSWPGSVANSESLIAAAGGPTATFIANTICFPDCGGSVSDGGDLASFLGGNASAVSPNAISSLADHVVVLTGRIDLVSGEQLRLGSDDGSALWINGAELIDNDGDHGFNWQSGTYSGPSGWQTIKILQFEDGGATGLSVATNAGGDWNGLGGAAIQAGVPEPATWAMMGLGFACLGFAGYRGSGRSARALVV
ncbi:putative secreted protein with PEP-CTERM sorting signal [Roseiarcus fermentans]|uniref:Putative secreted protein with PEP-CTERM sorting signal n=1 Tax=Roseiarcus fermentans TaxID=1473586 RepID=A0A366FI61_9HYPH|nr:PEP-CTERM sorting domain-containing protein [Roseiarcus fermentans]RBP14354.1 putative secreted protein with PEP-CTERM sorting signal [Roseiarcus fermentans]